MGRKTIDFGIDLGTTNSAIACMGEGELVIIRNQVTGSELTPSVVKMDARGSVTSPSVKAHTTSWSSIRTT
jgi:molecular chaperone DnaK